MRTPSDPVIEGLAVDETSVLGILSLMFWSLILIVTINSISASPPAAPVAAQGVAGVGDVAQLPTLGDMSDELAIPDQMLLPNEQELHIVCSPVLHGCISRTISDNTPHREN